MNFPAGSASLQRRSIVSCKIADVFIEGGCQAEASIPHMERKLPLAKCLGDLIVQGFEKIRHHRAGVCLDESFYGHASLLIQGNVCRYPTDDAVDFRCRALIECRKSQACTLSFDGWSRGWERDGRLKISIRPAVFIGYRPRSEIDRGQGRKRACRVSNSGRHDVR